MSEVSRTAVGPDVPSARLAGLVLAGTLVVRLVTASPFVESADGWAFVAGVEGYSVAEGRPHWPGYPLYIALGKLVALVTVDAVAALHVLAALSSTLVAWPLMVLAGRWTALRGAAAGQAQRAAALAGLLWMLLPGPWLTGTEILSDPTGLLFATGLLAVSWRSLQTNRESGVMLGGALALAMVGVRLAYAPLAAPLLFAAARVRALGARRRLVFLAVAGVLVTVATHLAADGADHLAAAIQRWHEHFGAWPRRVLDPGQLVRRSVAFMRAFVVYGCGGWWPGLPLVRLAPTVALALLGAAGLRALAGPPRADARRTALLFGAPYAVFTLLTQDMSLVRYSLPLLALACLVAALGLPSRWGAVAAAAACVAMLSVSLPLALERRTHPPLGHQLALYARDELRSATLLVSTDVAWLVPFLGRIAPRAAVYVVEGEQLGEVARRLSAAGHTIYATRPSALTPEEWTPVASFSRPRELDSRGPHQIGLYRLTTSGR